MIDIDKSTIDELVALRSDAVMSASSFSEAIKEQAESLNISRGALRRFICAREKGDLLSLDTESEDIAKLLNAVGWKPVTEEEPA